MIRLVGVFEENSVSLSTATETIVSKKWPVLVGAFLVLLGLLATLIDRSNGSPTPVLIGYACGLAGTVVAMYAASTEREVSNKPNYVRTGIDVLVVARVVRISALMVCLLNTYLIASVVAA